MSTQSEKELELSLIHQLETQGYERILIEDETELEQNLRLQLNKYNKSKLGKKELTDKEFSRILLHLGGRNVYQASEVLRDKYALEREDGSTVYIEFLGKEGNIFQVTNQITVRGKYENRYDVDILVNGLPLVHIEIKRRGAGVKEAKNQIERYRKHSFQGLFKYIQLYIVSNGMNTQYGANTDLEEIDFTDWTYENNIKVENLSTFAFEFLPIPIITKMLNDYMLVISTGTALTTVPKTIMVLRPYQVYAVRNVLNKVLNTHNGGYVWHTTGSGKTLTSFLISNILKKEESIDQVVFLVDRNDLDYQTTQEFNRFEKNAIDPTNDTKSLINQINNPNNKLILTTIQKMSRAVLKHEKGLAKIQNNRVVFIIDECHRSNFGTMFFEIKKFFKKAQYIGFTGTPIMKENKSSDGRTTADIFGNCLHTYLLKDAIHANSVLGFSVEYIQTIKGKSTKNANQKVEDIDKKGVYESVERLELVSEHLLNTHNIKTSNRSHCAIFATPSIKTLIKYYDIIMTKKDDDLKVAAIFTFGQNEESGGLSTEHSRDSLERIIKCYNKDFGTNFNTDNFKGYQADVQKRMKSAELDLLLVVNMMLTGFDSKPLSTLYVDKEMNYHNLIQAYSRTNRVKLGLPQKTWGNIVCYRNLKLETDAAIKLFSQSENANDVLVQDMGFYLETCKGFVKNIKSIAKTPNDVKNLEKETDIIAFVNAFQSLVKNRACLKQFIDYDSSIHTLGITEQEFEDYKSVYLDIYDRVRKQGIEKSDILDSIDFEVELIERDKINVDYILNLLASANIGNEEAKSKAARELRDLIGKTNDNRLKSKEQLVLMFLEEVYVGLKKDANVEEEFYNFLDKEKEKDVLNYANANGFDSEKLLDFVRDYTFKIVGKVIENTTLSELLIEDLSFIQKKKRLDDLKMYIFELDERY